MSYWRALKLNPIYKGGVIWTEWIAENYKSYCRRNLILIGTIYCEMFHTSMMLIVIKSSFYITFFFHRPAKTDRWSFQYEMVLLLNKLNFYELFYTDRIGPILQYLLDISTSGFRCYKHKIDGFFEFKQLHKKQSSSN